MRYPASTRDTDMIHNVTGAIRPYANFKKRNTSFANAETGPPYGVDRAMTPRRFGKHFSATSANGYIPPPHTGGGTPTTNRDHFTLGPRFIGQNAPYNPNQFFAPPGSAMPMRPPVMQPTPMMPESDRPAMVEIVEGGRPVQVQIVEGGRRLAHRDDNKSPNNGSDSTVQTTIEINFTISKDSSADESVRKAKLFADMGERSQRHRSGNDTESRDLSEAKVKGEEGGSKKFVYTDPLMYMPEGQEGGVKNYAYTEPRYPPGMEQGSGKRFVDKSPYRDPALYTDPLMYPPN